MEGEAPAEPSPAIDDVVSENNLLKLFFFRTTRRSSLQQQLISLGGTGSVPSEQDHDGEQDDTEVVPPVESLFAGLPPQ